jgi:opacity protein-like surface antigen
MTRSKLLQDKSIKTSTIRACTLALTLSTSMVAVSPALAEGSNYYSFGAGANFWNKQSNTDELESGGEAGYFAYASLIHEYNSQFRSEVELLYRRDKVHGINNPDEGFKSTGDGNILSSVGIFANASYELYPGSRFRPYVMVGIGVLSLTVDDKDNADNPLDDNGWTYGIQAGGGVRYQWSETITLSVNGRYLTSNPIDLDGLETEYDTTSFAFAMEFLF